MTERKVRPSQPSASTMRWPLGSNGTDRDAAATSPSVLGVADLQSLNAAVVLTAIRSASEPTRVSNLVRSTKLSRPTVEVIVEELLRFGLIEDLPGTSATGAVSPGRPARKLRFRADAAYVVGVDVRASCVNACVADLDGVISTTRRQTVRRDLTGAARVKAVEAAVRAVMADAGIKRSQVCAAAVGTPGWVQDNLRVRYVDNLKDWADVDIVGSLQGALECPIAIENDANLAALGEQWRGAATATNDLVFVLLGERVGAGIIAGGRPLHGHHGATGEIGFMVFPKGTALAARAIGEAGSQRPGMNPRSLYSEGAIGRRAAEGDKKALSQLATVGHRLADALAPVLLALDPALVVLGTSLFAPPYVDIASRLVLEAAESHAAELLVDPPDWRLSELGEDAVLTGAVRFALSGVDQILSVRPTSLFV